MNARDSINTTYAKMLIRVRCTFERRLYIMEQRKELLKDLLLSYGFDEEVKNEKLVLNLPGVDNDPNCTNCAIWCIQEDSYYFQGDMVSYSNFRRLIEPFCQRNPGTYQVEEYALIRLVSSLEQHIIYLCKTRFFTPPVLLDMYLEVWIKYNDMLRQSGADHFTDECQKLLVDLVKEKKDKIIQG